MKTNISMFRAPSNKAEFIQLLDEALRLADEINSQLDQIGKILKAEHEQCAMA